jgi:hypothetical protein
MLVLAFQLFNARTSSRGQEIINYWVFYLQGVQVVAGSNPVAPTRKIKHLAASLSA